MHTETRVRLCCTDSDDGRSLQADGNFRRYLSGKQREAVYELEVSDAKVVQLLRIYFEIDTVRLDRRRLLPQRDGYGPTAECVARSLACRAFQLRLAGPAAHIGMQSLLACQVSLDSESVGCVAEHLRVWKANTVLCAVRCLLARCLPVSGRALFAVWYRRRAFD